MVRCVTRRMNYLEFELRCFEDVAVVEYAIRFEGLVLMLAVGGGSAQSLFGTGSLSE